MKTLNVIGVFVLAPLAAAFFILAIGFKSAQAMAQYAFQSERIAEHETTTIK